jgi:hypothetical protein
MSRPPAALLLSRCGSVFYATEKPLVYVASDGRKIRLRTCYANAVPRAPAGPGPWEFAPGHIVDDCLFVKTPEEAGAAEAIPVWALYDRVQPAPARLSLARSASISSSMSATSAASSGAAS